MLTDRKGEPQYKIASRVSGMRMTAAGSQKHNKLNPKDRNDIAGVRDIVVLQRKPTGNQSIFGISANKTPDRKK